MVQSKSKRRLRAFRQQSQHRRIAELVKQDRKARQGSFTPVKQPAYSIMDDLERLARGA